MRNNREPGPRKYDVLQLRFDDPIRRRQPGVQQDGLDKLRGRDVLLNGASAVIGVPQPLQPVPGPDKGFGRGA